MTQPLSVFVVEDDPLISMMIEDFIETIGHDLAGSADSVAAALPKVEAGGFDVAIIDVNLRDGASWPIADALTARGIPFVVATGGHVEAPPAIHADVLTLAKPYTLDGIERALEHLGTLRVGSA